MAIFGKKPPAPQKPPVTPKPPQPAPAAPAPAPPAAPSPKAPAIDPNRSFLGQGCELDGEIHGAGSLECRGRINGIVELDGEILIGIEGRAKAQLTARRIVINGRLEGDAIGNEKVEVGASGHVEGDVRATAVLFAEGAFFEGNVEMRTTRPQRPDPAGNEKTDKGPQKSDS
jgi:cytoskeletal protein CcmA (bactofilin family)